MRRESIMRFLYMLGLIGLGVAFIGCDKHDLRLALTPGDVHILTYESERIIHIDHKEGDAKHRHTARYRLDVQQRTEDATTVHVTVEDMTTTTDMPKSWGEGDQWEPTIAVLARGLSFSIDINPVGKVTDVRGAEEVVAAITQSLQRPGVGINKVRPVVEQQFSKESIQELFTNLFAYVPEESVGVGDSWNDTQVHTTGMPFQSHVTYTLKSVENDVATVEYAATIESHYTKASIGLGMRYTFSGEEHGSMRVDSRTGWVVSGEGDLTLESQMDSTATHVTGTDRMESKGEL